jgi:peptidoglycan hydrolase-like protein with peptidoglycan-binding domain
LQNSSDAQVIKNVKALQALLNLRNNAGLLLDGDYGNLTVNAVRAYQSSKGLVSDGEAGPLTLNSLFTSSGNILVKNPTNGSAAYAAQHLLSKFESILVDGVFGATSANVSKTFQSRFGLLSDGEVGPVSLRPLFGLSHYINSGGPVYASPGAISTSPIDLTYRRANATYIYNNLRGQGYNKAAACAVLGNMQRESGIDPGVWENTNPSNRGFGLIQWSSTRLPGLMTHLVASYGQTSVLAWGANLLVANNPKSMMDGQLSYYHNEFNSGNHWGAKPGYSGPVMTSYTQFKTSTLSTGDLARVFDGYFERSNDSASTVTTYRVAYANEWYNYLP